MTSRNKAATPSFDCDVIVIGGGPAGTTAATDLARRGRAVTLFERDTHPRFHIGESLLPMNIPILERLGVLDAVERIGVRKPGADFPASNERGFNVFEFTRALGSPPTYAFQVQRAAFDEILLRNAQAAGVRVHEQTEVLSVTFEADCESASSKSASSKSASSKSASSKSAIVEVRDASGSVRQLRARYVVDASGRQTLLGTQLKLKERNRRHRSAAIFGHFTGVERRVEPYTGNISIYRFHMGWIWLIPLPSGITSIGAVCLPEHLKQRGGDLESFLMDILRSVPRLSDRVTNAKLAGHLEATGNYSYECRRICGPGWIMIGDAGAFVDPVFSSGVYLAMHGAERAAELVDRVLGGAGEARMQRAYAREIRGGISKFSWFIVRFTTPALAWLFANPRNILRVEDAMVAFLSGCVFAPAPALRRLRVFKLLYYVTSLFLWREMLRHFREIRRGAVS
jgi:flavin-dependent dehydrogenase